MDPVEKGVLTALTMWLDSVKTAVFPQVPGLSLPPDPAGVLSTKPVWGRLVDKFIVPPLSGILTRKAKAPNLAEWRAGYLEQTRNRLVRVPDDMHAKVITAINNGLTENDTPQELRDRVQAVIDGNGLEDWKNRAATIARTESIGAENAATIMQALTETRATGHALDKIWLSTTDPRTRETHAAANLQRVPLEAEFQVGLARLAWPGDHTAPFPDEVINCRCTVVVVERGEEWP